MCAYFQSVPMASNNREDNGTFDYRIFWNPLDSKSAQSNHASSLNMKFYFSSMLMTYWVSAWSLWRMGFHSLNASSLKKFCVLSSPQRKQGLHPNEAQFDSKKVFGMWRWEFCSSVVPPTHWNLMQLATWTRPDISYAVSIPFKFFANPARRHWTLARSVVDYLETVFHQFWDKTVSAHWSSQFRIQILSLRRMLMRSNITNPKTTVCLWNTPHSKSLLSSIPGHKCFKSWKTTVRLWNTPHSKSLLSSIPGHKIQVITLIWRGSFSLNSLSLEAHSQKEMSPEKRASLKTCCDLPLEDQCLQKTFLSSMRIFLFIWQILRPMCVKLVEEESIMASWFVKDGQGRPCCPVLCHVQVCLFYQQDCCLWWKNEARWR